MGISEPQSISNNTNHSIHSCYTICRGSYKGFIISSTTGRYEDYIIKEITPFVDKNYNISAHAVWGHSSGDYGSIVLGMRH
jgi:enterochelin esterase-like enzyme